MSQVASLDRSTNSGRVVIGGLMAKNTIEALSDEMSKRILVSTVSEGKTVQEIAVEQAVPLSSCYRRARELVRKGLLVVERIVVTSDGRRYSIYRSSFRSFEMASDFNDMSVSVELNEAVAEKFRRMWYGLSMPH